jgi:transposase
MDMTRNLILSDTDYAQVAARFKSEPNPRFRERLHCLLLKDQGYINTDVASILMVCPETITVWLDTFEQQGSEALCRMEAGGSDAYLTAEEIEALTKELDTHTFQNAKQVSRLGRGAVWRALLPAGDARVVEAAGLHKTESAPGARKRRHRGAGPFF